MGRGACVGVVLLLTVLSGCTKFVPIEVGQFDARQAVLVTFKDGSQIKGKITPGARIELTTNDTIYRSTITNLSENEIQISECRFISRMNDSSAEQARLCSAEHNVGEGLDGLTFQRADITQIDAVRLDVLKTTTRAVFWTVTSAVSALLLSEKS